MNISHSITKTKDKDEFVDPIGIETMKINDVKKIIFKKEAPLFPFLKKFYI